MATIKIDLTSDSKANITCKRGDTFRFQDLRYWDDEAKTIPTDLTGYSWAMKVVDADLVEVLSFSGADFVVHDTNYVRITKDAADMLIDASPEGQPYTYDLEETDADDIVRTIMSGTFTVEQDITNA